MAIWSSAPVDLYAHTLHGIHIMNSTNIHIMNINIYIYKYEYININIHINM